MALLKGNRLVATAGVVALALAVFAMLALKREQNRIEEARNVQLASATLPDQNAHDRGFTLPRAPSGAEQALPTLGGAGLPDNHLHDNILNERTTTPPAVNAYGLECFSDARVSATEGAMLQIEISAPCLTGEMVTIRHAGLSATAFVPESGKTIVDMPALADPAGVEITFPDGRIVEENIAVQEFQRIDRVVLMAESDASLTLHAFEFAATYGERGHVWRDSPGRRMMRGTAHGGFLSVVKGPNRRAEIYSFPNDTGQSGAVRLLVELSVTAQNCGTEVSGQTLEIRQGHRSAPVDLSFAVPHCDAVGDILVLNNLFQDMTLAQN